MKSVIAVLIIFGLFIGEAGAQKKIEFDFPDDIVDSSKAGFVKDFNKGHVLYTITCSKCHNITENKKVIIPDFSLPQLMDYEMRMYSQHSEELTDTKLTDEEMQKVIIFLRYKKKSNVPAVKR